MFLFVLIDADTVDIMISTAGGHGDVNPNKNWIESKGMFVFYFITIVSLHLILLSLPMISISIAWTMTNITHNLVTKNKSFEVKINYS